MPTGIFLFCTACILCTISKPKKENINCYNDNNDKNNNNNGLMTYNLPACYGILKYASLRRISNNINQFRINPFSFIG